MLRSLPYRTLCFFFSFVLKQNKILKCFFASGGNSVWISLSSSPQVQFFETGSENWIVVSFLLPSRSLLTQNQNAYVNTFLNF